MNGRRTNAQTGPDSPAENSRITRAAAQWRSRIDAGFEAGEDEKFSAWLEADPRHADTFREMDVTWSILDRSRELPERSLAPDPGSDPKVVRRRQRRYWMPATLAAAAAVALFVGWGQHRAARSNLASTRTAAAAPGMVHRLNLPDGSVVRLNSDSAVVTHYSERERRVTLERGEASFTVAKDSSRPFVVTTAGVSVRAVGTTFHVSMRAAEVEVLVTEGKVKVNDASKGASLLAARPAEIETVPPDILTAGTKVVIAVPRAEPLVAAAPVAVTAPEIARALAWQERRIEFNATPLGEIAREFNRYNQHQLVIADAELARLGFGGSFRVDDPDTFVRLIETRSDVVVERRPYETIVRTAR